MVQNMKRTGKFKRLKKMAVLLSACLFLVALAGCSESTDSETNPGGTQSGASATQTENAKGRYLETEVKMPEKISHVIGVKRCSDDSIVVVGTDDNEIAVYKAVSKNRGKDWEETKLEAENTRYAAVNDDGTVALMGYFTTKENSNIEIVDKDGKVTKLDISLPEYEGALEDSGNMITSAVFAAGKLLITEFEGRIYEVDKKSGELTKAVTEIGEEVHGLISLGNRIVLLTKNGVRIADAEKGTLLPEDTELQKAVGTVEDGSDRPIYPVMFAASEKEDELYFVSHGGIFYHKQGGSTTEQLVNGELVSLGDGSTAFMEFIRFDDEHFMVFVVDSLGNDRCYNYEYDAEASAVPEKQLNVYALADSAVLQQAISAFQKENPDVFVKKTIGMTDDNGVTAEDAIKTLNTEIMAGNGSDVFVLDGLPADSYVEKGIISDIGSIMEDADKKDGLFTNITDACKKDGKVYQVPLRFYFTAAEWDSGIKEISGGPQEIADYIKTLKEGNKPVMPSFPAEMSLYSFYDAYSAVWKDENGINSDALKDSLEAAKTLYDLDGYAEDERWSYKAVFSDMLYMGQIIYGTLGQGSNSRLTGDAKVSIGTLNGVGDVMSMYGLESSKAGSFGMLSQGEQRAFVPVVSLGLADAAKDNELAKEFIKTALSADGQHQMTNYFSINKKAYENECKNAKAYSIGGSDGEGRSFGYEVKPLNEKQQNDLTAMIESLNTCMWNDRVVQDLVISEGAKYLRGEQSLEDAVSAITKKVQLYVSE